MKRLVRLVGAGTLTVGALLCASPAVAAISPKLAVTPATRSSAANLIIAGGSSSPAEDTFAKIQVFVPAGFGLTAPPGGASVGSASGHVVVKDIDPTRDEAFAAKIVAIGPTDPAVAWENANCDGGPHAAAWMMQLDSPDGQSSFPIFVDRTSGSEASFGPYELVFCLRPSDTPASDPNHAPAGTKLENFVLTLTGFTLPANPGDYRWRSLWTPYTPGTGTVNTAGSVEAQSIVTIPAGVLRIAAELVPTTVHSRVISIVRLRGKLAVNGEPAGGFRVGVVHGTSPTHLVALGSVPAAADGRFSITSRVPTATYFQAGVTVPRQELGPAGCTPSFGAGVQCVNASISGARILSRVLYVKPY
jgi:hypothetical protein